MWLDQTQFRFSKKVNSKICRSVSITSSSQIKIDKATSDRIEVINWKSPRKKKKEITQVTFSNAQYVRQILKREKSHALYAVFTFSTKTALMCGFSKSRAVVLFVK